jgi:protocatechuate 3,4-dioxygenase beta subunit
MHERHALEAGSQPPLLYPPYASTVTRAPRRPMIKVPASFGDLAAPVYGYLPIGDTDNDLTRQHPGDAQGERIIVSGQVLDEDGRPVAHTLVEIWQANAAGRYLHVRDTHPAPLDPNFSGNGRTITDAAGRYRFVSIKPGSYPWMNHPNAWRPAHIHFSLFGHSLATRLVTQMYFPGDPLFAHDPIVNSIPDERARQRLVSTFDLSITEPNWALGYRFDIILRGRHSTPFEGRA